MNIVHLTWGLSTLDFLRGSLVVSNSTSKNHLKEYRKPWTVSSIFSSPVYFATFNLKLVLFYPPLKTSRWSFFAPPNWISVFQSCRAFSNLGIWRDLNSRATIDRMFAMSPGISAPQLGLMKIGYNFIFPQYHISMISAGTHICSFQTKLCVYVCVILCCVHVSSLGR